MLCSLVRSFSILAIAVVASSSASVVSNLASVSSSSQDCQNQRDHGSCVDGHSVRCLRECTESDVDNDEYADSKMNSTKAAAGGIPQEGQRLSWPYMALLSLLWVFCFASFDKYQLVLLVCALAVTGCSNGDIGVVVSFLIVGLLYYLAAKIGADDGYHLEPMYAIDGGLYYGNEAVLSFCVPLGRFTWEVSGYRNHH